MKNIILNKYKSHKEIIINFAWRGLQIFSSKGILFIIFILCAKLLDPYTFGIYNYILAIISLLIILGDFGISTATSKFVAQYNAIDKDKLKILIFNSLFIIFLLGSIITIITILFGKYFLKENYNYALFALPIIFLSPMSSIYDGIYRGLKRFRELAIFSLTRGIFSIIFFYLLISNYGIIGALISKNLFYLFLLIGLALNYKNIKLKLNKQILKEVFKYSCIIGIATTGYFLYSGVDVLVLQYFGFTKEIGYYALINKFFTLLMQPFAIFAQTIAPNISKYYFQKDFHKVKEKFKKYSLYSVIISTFIVICSYIIYPFIMKTFLSEYYVKEFIIMINILLPIFIIKSLSGGIITLGFTTPTGHASLNMKILLFTGPLNVILNIIFIHLFGFIGVIYATLVVWLIANTLLVSIYYFKHIK